MNIGKKTAAFLLLVFVVIVLYALVPQVKDAVNYTLVKVIGEPAFNGLQNLAAGITSHPIYQTYHPLLWIGGTFIAAFALHQLHVNNKIPGFRVQPKQSSTSLPPPMAAPQTIIIREEAQPTKTQTVIPEVKKQEEQVAAA